MSSANFPGASTGQAPRVLEPIGHEAMCAICGRTIGAQERAFEVNGAVRCAQCQPAPGATAPAPASAAGAAPGQAVIPAWVMEVRWPLPMPPLLWAALAG